MIVHPNLFSDLEGLMNRLSSSTTVNNSASKSTSYSTPPMDVYRRGSDVWVHVDLPGVANDSLDINVERSVLTITAQREVLRQDGDHVFKNERRRGALRRTINLGDNLDPEGIEANFSNGVLTLRVPVAEQAKARKVDVSFTQVADDIVDTADVVDGPDNTPDTDTSE